MVFVEASDWTMDIEVDLRRAFAGGVLGTLVAAIGAYAVGHLSGAEAKLLMETTLPRTQALAGTVILASATILALMLTLLGVSTGADSDIKPGHYQRVRQIALVDAIVFSFAMVVNLILNVPFVESNELPTQWYNVLYYVALGTASLMGGALISIVLMIYNTVSDVIQLVGVDSADHAGSDSEEEKEEREEAEGRGR